MRLGKNQLHVLAALGSPGFVLLVPGRETRSMVKAGLLREREPGGAVCITPAGLRRLADEMERGRVDDGLNGMQKMANAREAAQVK